MVFLCSPIITIYETFTLSFESVFVDTQEHCFQIAIEIFQKTKALMVE